MNNLVQFGTKSNYLKEKTVKFIFYLHHDQHCFFSILTPQAGPTESFNLHEGLDPVHIGGHHQLHLPWGGLVQKDLEQQDVIIIKQIRPK